MTLYRALLRLFWRRTDPATRLEMTRDYAAAVDAAFARGPLHGLLTAGAECGDLVLAPLRRDPLSPRPHVPTSPLRRGAGMFPSLHDWRAAGRRMFAHPGYSALVVAILALGIAINTVVFSVADSALFRGLPYPNGPRLVEVFNMDPQGKFSFPGLTADAFDEWRSHGDVFEALEGFQYADFVSLGGAEPQQVFGAYVTPGLFHALGVTPQRGRLFDAGDGDPGRNALVLISDAFWRQRFGASDTAIGQTVTLNDTPFTVIGVMPRRFRVPASHQHVWLPAPARPEGRSRLEGLALLPTGLSAPAAQARLDALGERLATERPRAAGWRIRIMPPRGARLNPPTERALQVLTIAVLIVLLIACANLANLGVAHALARKRELAVRAALGASRWRLVRELIAEHLALGAVGGAIGLALAFWGVGFAIALAPSEITLWSPNEIRIDTRILGFSAVATLASALLFGILPAWRASRADAGDALRSRTAGAASSHGRIRAALVIAEVALSVVLLTGAALLIRSFVKLAQLDPGFDPRGLVSVSLQVATDRYPAGPARRAFFDRVVQAVRGVPGVTAVSVANGVPTAGGNIHFGALEIEGKEKASGEIVLPNAVVDFNYFETLGLPILAGRPLAEGDTAMTAVVGQSFARRLADDGNAVGTRFRLDERSDWYTVVGVAGEVRQSRMMERNSLFEIYTPLWRPASTLTPPPAAATRVTGGARSFVSLRLLLRARPGSAVAAPVKAAIWSVDPAQTVGDIQPVDELLALSLAQDRFATLLMGTFAALALILAAAGLYAVLAHLVTQRRQEIGIRIALGAATPDVARLILGRGVALTAIGIGIGLAGAWAAARFLASQLYEVAPHDAASFTLVPVVLLAIALLASWLPARRALAVDPATVLRTE
jgi:putative ABC transport system permease protein